MRSRVPGTCEDVAVTCAADLRFDEVGTLDAAAQVRQPRGTCVRNGVIAGSEVRAYTYAYDASGQRVRKVVVKGSIQEERIYLGSYEVWRKKSSGTLAVERQTLHIMDGQRRIAMVETLSVNTSPPPSVPNTRIRYQLDDHLGTASLETDEAGAGISYEEYHPYGSTAWYADDGSLDGSPKRYKYTGMERDDETGLQYHSARYYAPWLGRWASADPSGQIDGTNTHRYARGSPIGSEDTSGRVTFVETLIVVSAPLNSDEPDPSPPPVAPEKSSTYEVCRVPRELSTPPPPYPKLVSQIVDVSQQPQQQRREATVSAPTPLWSQTDIQFATLGPGGSLIAAGKAGRAVVERDSSYLLWSERDRVVGDVGDTLLTAAALPAAMRQANAGESDSDGSQGSRSHPLEPAGPSASSQEF